MKQTLITGIMLGMVAVAAAQNCPSLGPDIELECGESEVTLMATFDDCPVPLQTNTYGVSQITFAPNPTTGTPITLTDDAISQVLPIGFTFCFFGNSYTQFYISSNGWIGFTPNTAWTTFTSQAIPSTVNSVPKNCIMGPWQDWNPGIAGGPYIRYQTIGQAPCRKLVVSFTNIPFFSCTSTLGTFQIVLNEGSNIIENHITNKPSCGWAGGTAVQGVHNLAGTVGITVPGRNSTVWTTTNNAWQFTPSGAPAPVTYSWFEVGNPQPIATGPQSSITVNPPPGGASYTVQLNYTGCYGICSEGLVADTVNVIPGGSSVITLETSVIDPICHNACDGAITVTAIGGTPEFTYQWLPDVSSSETAGNLCPGNYTVTVTDVENCVETTTITITNPPQITIGGQISHN